VAASAWGAVMPMCSIPCKPGIKRRAPSQTPLSRR
jgi:hypothetical protein